MSLFTPRGLAFRIKWMIQDHLRKSGREIVRQPLMKFLEDRGINLVLDAGASIGGYGMELRRLGYTGRIVSFEPLPNLRKQLKVNAAKLPPWQVLPLALGSNSGTVQMNIASNGDSSSLLVMAERHRKASPDTVSAGSIPVQVARLDEVYWQHCQPEDRVFLKIDTQGFEKQILEGTGDCLNHVVGLQLELSLVPLYEGQSLIEELIAWVRAKGFSPVSFTHGFRDPETCELLQMDGIFFRNP